MKPTSTLRRSRRVFTTAAAVMIGGSSSVLACPVCFGAEETSMIDGTKLGVLVMLAITLAVQGGFVGFFLYLRKRAKRIADIELDTEWSELQRSVENIMTEWLGLPPLASAHGGQIDSLIGWIHMFMLILFVGWGGFFVYALIRFRQSRNPVADYTGVKSHASNYSEIGVAVVEAVLLFGFAIPLWAARVDDMPAGERSAGRSGHRRAVRLEHPLCRPRRGIRPHRHQAARPPVEPPGTRSLRSRREGRRHDAQSALSAREQADHREAQEQGRHPQLRRARVSREAGRHPRPDDPHLVRPQRHDRGDADPDGESRVPVPDCLRAALRSGPFPDAGLRHRPDRRGVPEVDGRTEVRRSSQRRIGPLPVSELPAALPFRLTLAATRTSSGSASARGSARALRRSRGRGRSCGRTPRRP